MKRQPLSGIRILVGRTRHQAGALSSELRKLGAEVVEIPFIEIRQPKSFKPLDAALTNLDTYDWLILTSVNGVEAMWARMEKLKLGREQSEGEYEIGRAESRGLGTSGAKAGAEKKRLIAALKRCATQNQSSLADCLAAGGLRIAAIGPATQKAIEQHGVKVDVVPKEYVAESVVKSLRRRVKGKRVLLVRAKVARDVIPRELRKAGAKVDVVEAYETVVPQSSRRRLQAVLKDPQRSPQVITFTSSSAARNFVALIGGTKKTIGKTRVGGMRFASIGPVTSTTLRELGLRADIEARKFTIPGLVDEIVRSLSLKHGDWQRFN